MAFDVTHHAPLRRRAPAVPNAVLGTLIFVVAESMFFAGFVSAFTIARTTALTAWPPPGQPRLPIEATAFNTAALVLSGLVMWWAGRRSEQGLPKASAPLLVATLLGAVFVLFQGVEWAKLMGQGLNMTATTHGAFFFMIVGAHALHAIGALVVLVSVYTRLRRGTLTAGGFAAARVFWYFVVSLWPILYWRVYL
jgi:cytochrome c oxidase subunit III